MKYYVNKCPDTNRVFICELNVDNNLCEVFSHNGDEATVVAARICAGLLGIRANEGLLYQTHMNMDDSVSVRVLPVREADMVAMALLCGCAERLVDILGGRRSPGIPR